MTFFFIWFIGLASTHIFLTYLSEKREKTYMALKNRPGLKEFAASIWPIYFIVVIFLISKSAVSRKKT